MSLLRSAAFALALSSLASGVTACTSGAPDDGTGGTFGHASGGSGGNGAGGTAGSDTGGAAGSQAGGEGGSGGTVTDGGGAGGNDASSGGAGGDIPDSSIDAPPGCVPISLVSIQPYPTSPDTVLFSYYFPETGGSDPDQILIEWFPPSGQNIEAGTYDLSQPPDDNYATCVHCVRGAEDIVGTEETKSYYPASGSLIIHNIDTPLDGKSKGSLVNVKLVEVTIDQQTGQSTPVAGGSCLYINSASWDLTAGAVEAGAPCSNAEECGDPAHFICDPSSATCQSGQCDHNDPCPDANDICISQIAAATVGACYPKCTPFTSGNGCAPNEECITASWDQLSGYCNKRGSNLVGQPCTRIDLSTDCVAGAQCRNIGTDVYPDFRCVQQCSFFSTGTTRVCTDPDFACFQGGNCLETTTQQVDAAGIGEPCSVWDFVPCGLDPVTGIARGVCDNYFTSGAYYCYQTCRLGSNADCGAGTCTDVLWNNGLGDCH